MTGILIWTSVTLKNVQAFKTELKENQYAYGVKGHKMDRADENFSIVRPLARRDHQGTSPEELLRLFVCKAPS